jgi:hypothetical protein
MPKVVFSGHETFHCRQFWLKKGYDFLQAERSFKDEDAVVGLGVGKNMVSSIRYWMKAFDLIDEQERLNQFAHTIFGEHGKDPYLEDEGTIWLLHYRLVTRANASIYSLFFNEFRRERIEFTKEQLLKFLIRKCEEVNFTVSKNSLQVDIDVLMKNYLRPKRKTQNIEDDFSGLFIDLDILQEFDRMDSVSWYTVKGENRDSIPVEIILYAILDQESGSSISLDKLRKGNNSVGVVYAMSDNGLMNKIQEITDRFPNIIFSDDAGIRELQFKEKLSKEELLDTYYAD